MAAIVCFVLALAAIAGCIHMAAAAWFADRLRRPPPPLPADCPTVSLLKPLHGPEPLLAEKLATFRAQQYPADVEMICGVADPDDPALAAAHEVGARIVVDAARLGANAKVSNLAAMAPHASGRLIVLSDDDIAVEPDYLRRIAAALRAPGAGCVTCLYSGRGDTGLWSRIAAAGISWQFLPSALVGIVLGLARPCMGSTIALRAETLAAIGGFARFADILADDYAIGAAVREQGLAVVVPTMLVTHGCGEESLAALVRHELRWLATVRGIDFAGHLGSVVTYPLPLGLLAGIAGAGWWIAGLALLVRFATALRFDAIAGRRTAPLWMLPVRDGFGFALFLASFFVRRVDWRGARLVMGASGRISAPKEPSIP